MKRTARRFDWRIASLRFVIWNGGRRPLNRRGAAPVCDATTGSAAAAKPPLADGVARLLTLAEEFLVAHHRHAWMVHPPMRDVGLVIRHADHEPGGLSDPLADEPGAG